MDGTAVGEVATDLTKTITTTKLTTVVLFVLCGNQKDKDNNDAKVGVVVRINAGGCAFRTMHLQQGRECRY